MRRARRRGAIQSSSSPCAGQNRRDVVNESFIR
jgi:hypothetical protein